MTQHAAHIRRRNRQVQESLEFDRQMLDTIDKIEQNSVLEQQMQKERARTIAAQMKQSMEDRLRIERQRECEIDRLDRWLISIHYSIDHYYKVIFLSICLINPVRGLSCWKSQYDSSTTSE